MATTEAATCLQHLPTAERLTPMLDEAVRLAQLGLAVHWLRGPTGGNDKGRGKAPIHGGWQKRPALTESELRREYRSGYNLGLHCGSVPGAKVQLVALDCDGREAVDFLVKRGIAPTPIKTKTRKGFHLLYRHPGGFVPTRLKVEGQPIDLIADSRAGGMNLVGPPSVHPSGFVYQAIGGAWTAQKLAELPVFDPSWFPVEPPPVPSVRRKLVIHRIVESMERTLSCARQSLAKMRPGIQGQNGGRATLVAALMLAQRFQLDENQIFELLSSDYNPRCVPPWSERELMQKARDAVRIAAGRP